MSSLLRGCLQHVRQARMCSHTMCPNPAVLPTIRQCWEILWHFTRNFLSNGIIVIKFQSPSFFFCHQNINPDTIRLCQTHADAICDSSGKIKPEPVRTKRREFFRAFFYIGIGKQWKLWLLLFISKVYGLNGYIFTYYHQGSPICNFTQFYWSANNFITILQECDTKVAAKCSCA